MRQRVVPVVPPMEVPAVPMHSAAHSTGGVASLMATAVPAVSLGLVHAAAPHPHPHHHPAAPHPPPAAPHPVG